MSFELVEVCHDLPYVWSMAFQYDNGMYYTVSYQKGPKVMTVCVIQIVDGEPLNVDLIPTYIYDLLSHRKTGKQQFKLHTTITETKEIKVRDWMDIVNEPTAFFAERIL